MNLGEVLAAFQGLSEAERASLTKQAAEAASKQIWFPNPGPQTDAYFCEADELFYGGQAGGGKSDLLIGLSLTAHQRSLVLRRTNKEASKLVDRYAEIIGTREGYSSQNGAWRIDGRLIDIGGCQLESDKQKYKGSPHDLIAFDELPDFTESQYTFLTGWNRSTEPGQRCRVVAAGNPPTTAEGLWVTIYWAPWLDRNHPNPAKPGELRWFLGQKEVDGPGPHEFEGKMVRARSRTFIPAALEDNPDLADTGYDSVLAALPEALRRAYRDGDFGVGLQDDPWQVIPTQWVRDAQARWTPQLPQGVPMCAIGVDPASGGPDDTVLAPRYDGYYPELIATPGKLTPLGSDVAGLVVARRRDDAKVIIDMGGGYGGGPYEHLIDNIGRDAVVAYKGAESTSKRTADQKLSFINVRSMAYWRFREALDPDQVQGSPIALPPDQKLVADLTAPRFKIGSRGIQITPKEELVAILGRSPDRGDAVVMAWHDGAKAMTHATLWRQDQRLNRNVTPKVNTGRRRH